MDLHPLRKQKELLYNAWKTSKSVADFDAYKVARNSYIRAIRQQKVAYASRCVEKIDGLSGKPWWKTVNEILGRGVTDPVPPLQQEGRIVSDPEAKANLLNTLFAKKASVPDNDRESIPPLPTSAFSL